MVECCLICHNVSMGENTHSSFPYIFLGVRLTESHYVQLRPRDVQLDCRAIRMLSEVPPLVLLGAVIVLAITMILTLYDFWCLRSIMTAPMREVWTLGHAQYIRSTYLAITSDAINLFDEKINPCKCSGTVPGRFNGWEWTTSAPWPT